MLLSTATATTYRLNVRTKRKIIKQKEEEKKERTTCYLAMWFLIKFLFLNNISCRTVVVAAAVAATSFPHARAVAGTLHTTAKTVLH